MDGWLDKFVKDVAGEGNRSVSPGALWIPDDKCRACIGCALPFSIFVRRHHCRLCGHLFCSQCAKHFIPPLKTCPDQTWRRVCKFCRHVPQSSPALDVPKIRLVQHHAHFQCLKTVSTAAEALPRHRLLADEDPEQVPGCAPSSSDSSLPSLPTSASSAGAPSSAVPGASSCVSASFAAPAVTRAASGPASSSAASRGGSAAMMRGNNPFAQVAAMAPSLNRQTSFPYKTAQGEGALTWEVPPPLDLEVGGATPPPQIDVGPNGVPEYEPNLVGLHKGLLEAVAHKHLTSITQQLLAGEHVQNAEVWVPIIMRLAKEASSMLSAQRVSISKDRDPRSYVKVKKLPDMYEPADSGVVHGVVCKKNVANRRMRSHIDIPRIALLANSLEFARQANTLSHFDSVLDKEKDALSKSVDRIIDVGPDVLVVEKNVARSVQEELLKHSITLVQNVKMDLLERLRRTTNAQIVQSVSELTVKHLGVCSSFTVEPLGAGCMKRAASTMSTTSVGSASAAPQTPLTPPGAAKAADKARDGGGQQRTLMFFNGVPQPLGCTILLKGASAEELRKLKRVVSFMTYATYHASLEAAFIAEQMSVGLVSIVDGLLEMPNANELLHHLAQVYIQDSADIAAQMPRPYGIASASPYVWRDKTDKEIEETLAAAHFARGYMSLQSNVSGMLRSLGSFRVAELLQEEMDDQPQGSPRMAEPSTSSPLRIEPEDSAEAEASTSAAASLPPPSPLLQSPLPVSAELAEVIGSMPSEAASTSTPMSVALESASERTNSESEPASEPSPKPEADAGAETAAASPSRVQGSSVTETPPQPQASPRPVTPLFTDPLRRPEVEVVEEAAEEEQPQEAEPEPEPAAVEMEESESDAAAAALARAQDAALLDIYKQQHIYITISNRNPKRNMFCETHNIKSLSFYGPEDLSLASFIVGACPHPSRKCHKEDCGEGVTCHVRTFMHGSHRITMSFVSLPPEAALPYENEGRIWFWARPKHQGSTALRTVRRTLLSRTSSSISLGKFLELCLCGHSLTVLDLSLHLDFVRYFGVGRAVMCMHQDRIKPSQLSMPDVTMQYTTRAQLAWLHFEGGELLQEANDLFDWVECALPGLAIFKDVENLDSLNFYTMACQQDRNCFTNMVHQCLESVKHSVQMAEEQGSLVWIDILVAGLMDLNRKRKQLALAQLTWAAFMKDHRFFDRVPYMAKSIATIVPAAFMEPLAPPKPHRYTYSMDSTPSMDGSGVEARQKPSQNNSLDFDQLDAMSQRAELLNNGLPIMTIAGVSNSAVADLISTLEGLGCGLLDGSKALLEQCKRVSNVPSIPISPENGTTLASDEPVPEEQIPTGAVTPPPSAGSTDGGDEVQHPHTEDHESSSEGSDDELGMQDGGWACVYNGPASHNIDVPHDADEENSELCPKCEEDDESVGYGGGHQSVEGARSVESSPGTRYFSPAGTAATTAVDWGTPKSGRSGEDGEVTGPFRSLESVSPTLEVRSQSMPAAVQVPEPTLNLESTLKLEPTLNMEPTLHEGESSSAERQPGTVSVNDAPRDRDQGAVLEAESSETGTSEASDATGAVSSQLTDDAIPTRDAATPDTQGAGTSGVTVKNPLHNVAAQDVDGWRISSHAQASTSNIAEPRPQLSLPDPKLTLKPLLNAPLRSKTAPIKRAVPGQELEKNAKLPMPGRTMLPEGHHGMVIPIFDGEPTSTVSYFLASKQYRKNLADFHNALRKAPDDKREDWELLMSLKERDSTVMRLDFTDESPGLPSARARFQVLAPYAVQFAQLRSKCLMGGEDAFIASLSRCRRWQNRGGKSNAYFARTRDERFIIKGLSKAEKQSLLEFAPAYFAHLSNVIKGNQRSSLAKIFGVFTVSMKSLGSSSSTTGLFKDGSLDIIVMENIFYDHQITRIYDLKGSERSRFNQEAATKPNDTGVVHLDDNLRRNSQSQPILVDTTSHHLMETALWGDTDFLAGLGVMDYSLLVGVDRENNRLFVALIDYIRTYTWDKQLETWVKSSGILGGGGKEPTIISPKQYMKRFRTAMQGYFTMVPNSSHFEPPLQPDSTFVSPPHSHDASASDSKQGDKLP